MDAKLKPLDRQVMVITGASSGIGLATARAAAKQGAKLVLAARSEETLADEVDRVRDRGGEAIYVVADVGDKRQVNEIAEQAISQFGRIDTWVNDAGVSIYGRFDQILDDDNRRLFETNFWGVVNGSLVALPHLKKEGGALINIGSELSDATIALQGMYAASKHAVKGFTDALRIEVEEMDKAPVAITLIQPTAVDTPYPQHARNYMQREPKLPTPMIQPEDVAEAILQAATERKREVKVGTMSKLNTTMAKVMPSLGDKIAAKQATRQQREDRPRNPTGALYAPGASDNKVRGDGG